VPHEIVERGGLACKPCAIHGGDVCPIRTFACMKELAPDIVIGAVRRLLSR
jgi:heptosyltransferase-2